MKRRNFIKGLAIFVAMPLFMLKTTKSIQKQKAFRYSGHPNCRCVSIDELGKALSVLTRIA